MIKYYYFKAFSIVELLVVIAIAAIMLSIVAPSFRWVISKNHASSYTNELIAALRFARFTAIKLGKQIKFCGSSDQESCNAPWQNGSIIMTTTDKILRVLPPVFAKDKLTCTGGDGAITFSPSGFAKGRQRSFYYCPRGSSENALAVILYSTGRVRLSNKTHEGKRIPCNL